MQQVELFRLLSYYGVRWFETDVSGLPTGPIFKNLGQFYP
jgi:hypothetical protein